MVRARVPHRMHLGSRPTALHVAGNRRCRHAAPRSRASSSVEPARGPARPRGPSWQWLGCPQLGVFSHKFRCTPIYYKFKLQQTSKIRRKINTAQKNIKCIWKCSAKWTLSNGANCTPNKNNFVWCFIKRAKGPFNGIFEFLSIVISKNCETLTFGFQMQYSYL